MSATHDRTPDEPTLADMPSLEAFGERLMAADPRRGRTRGGRGTTGGAALLGSVVALATFTGAAAVALTATTGSPVPSFARGDDVGFYPEPGTTELSDVRAPDPGGGPPWTVRVGRSGDGLVCLGAGQVRGADFGVRGLDGVFRTNPPQGNDACGPAPTQRRPAVGLKAFSGPRPTSPTGATTVVYGAGGSALRSVSVATGDGGRTAAPVGRSGTFAVAASGWPEGVAPLVRLRWADGARRTVRLGPRSFVPDPAGRYGWRADLPFGAAMGTSTEGCLYLAPARETNRPRVACVPLTGRPTALVRLRAPGGESRQALLVRIAGGERVTVAVGGREVVATTATTAGAPRRVVRWRNGRRVVLLEPAPWGGPRAAVAVLRPDVPPEDVRVRIHHRGGTTTVVPRSTGAGR
jgi:hypothetical protein